MALGRAVGKGIGEKGIIVIDIPGIACVTIHPQDIRAATVTGIRLTVRPAVTDRRPGHEPPLIRERRAANCIHQQDRRRGLLDLSDLRRGEITPACLTETGGNVIKLDPVTDFLNRGILFGLCLEIVHITGPGVGLERIAEKGFPGRNVIVIGQQTVPGIST